MPRKRVPCASCGRPLWTGPGSLPAGQRWCHDCRRTQPRIRRILAQHAARQGGRAGTDHTPPTNTLCYPPDLMYEPGTRESLPAAPLYGSELSGDRA